MSDIRNTKERAAEVIKYVDWWASYRACGLIVGGWDAVWQTIQGSCNPNLEEGELAEILIGVSEELAEAHYAPSWFWPELVADIIESNLTVEKVKSEVARLNNELPYPRGINPDDFFDDVEINEMTCYKKADAFIWDTIKNQREDGK